ncbi:MAG TPA: VWA domain-containing protein [Bryobacteraceae bacterium]|jgi:VWFA-related protein|nr:VWA domain-containing protein [Bryobacteraceae bacterium]
MIRATIALILFGIAAALPFDAQQVGGNAPAGGTTQSTFSTSSQLVVETVNVKDKSGKPIEGLTAKDFTITEDGAEQMIRLFEFQKVSEAAEGQPPIRNLPPPLKKLPETQITTEKPGDIRYQDRRLLVLYFDMTAMPPQDQLRAITAAEKFVRTQMIPADRLAIMRFEGGAVRVASDFTDDRERLISILETMIVGESQGFDEATSDDSTPDTGAAFGQDDSEFNIFNTNRQLSALQTAARMLGQLSEKKSVLYFASGLRLNGVDNQAQLHATINAAVRAGVSFWPIDARGLVATAPMGDATQGSPGGRGMYTGGGAMALTANFQQSQDTLYALASDTGGKALLDNNDLAMGIVQAEKSVSSYYILGYYATNTALDGKFRRIKITLNNGEAGSLDYRQGYFAGKSFGKFTVAEKERQLEDALMLGDPITELTIAMEVDYFQLNRAEYFVPVSVKIPGRELALARKGGAERTLIDFIGEVKDDYGSTIQNVRDKYDIKLSGETAAQLAKRPIEYATGFTLLPGKYKIKFLARDAETGRIGTYETSFVIPNLNKEEKRIPLSSVVLSSQRVDLKEAISNALKSKDQAETTNPLVQDGQKLIPSVTRVFSKSRDMYVYLQAYEPAAATIQPLVAFVAFYRGSEKVFQTPPQEIKEGMSNRLKTMPLRFDLSLGPLAPGAYNCQVTVLDPTGQKAAFWQAPVMVVQ